jgi:hypothetical protein
MTNHEEDYFAESRRDMSLKWWALGCLACVVAWCGVVAVMW